MSLTSKSYVGLQACFYCGESMGVLIDRRMKDTFDSTPLVVDTMPCDKCAEYMRQGVILISIRNGSGEVDKKRFEKEKQEYELKMSHRTDQYRKKHPFVFMQNPYRTGGWCVVTSEAAGRILGIDAEVQRCAFVEDELWDKVGLPRE